MSNESENLGVGLDVGTMNFVCARQNGNDTKFHSVRDAFLDLELESKKTLKMSQVDYQEIGGQLYVFGDKALQMANLFKRDIRRPLSRGLVSPGELKSHEILESLISKVLDLTDRPVPNGTEHCFYSVPAEPIDLPGHDVVFHTETFRKILETQGYIAHPMNEAMAIIYSECASSGFSGLALSFGAGLCNIALSFQAMMGMSFSLAQGGGDWVDTHSAKAVGSTASRMCAIKERGDFSLNDPPEGNQEAEAIALYVRSLIRNCLTEIAKKVRKDQSGADVLDPIPMVVSGGTTLAKGFMEVFQDEFNKVREKGFPIKISEIRRVANPLEAVAKGLLVLAQQEHTD
jgi:hypothetical protein